jgi:ATPase subunit of ABC transporter with duplicated ATPase domains
VKNKRPLIIDFSEMKKSGVKVLELKSLLLDFGFKEKISYEIFSGDRILISGKNGSGKSTLIKKILENKNNTDNII